MPPFDFHAADLAALSARGRLRALAPRAGHDFSSNDYLGLARDPRLAAAVEAALARGAAIGSGGSRLLRGNDGEHEALEAEAAAFFGAEAALFFANGYMANLALLSALPQPGDLIVHDAWIHASAHDGMRLSRAPSAAAAHNDPGAFEAAIAGWRRGGGRGTPWIVVESLYSMDGDRAPLAALAEVAARHEGVLLVDEAHATGAFGAGLAEHLHARREVVTLHTCGKALGCEGALVCGPSVVRDFLVNRARSFIFTTAPSPLMAAAVREALRILAGEPERQVRLHQLVTHASEVLAPFGVAATGSQILPLILGDDVRAMAAAAALQARGFDVRGIRPPTVPEGTSRLRLSITLNVDEAAIDALGEALGEVLG
ncbi:8-amino-7-oxononanoate synthase [Sphingomonas sp.]|uniref:8-amino-7-oxononanoate synthase n=1 Tax=Sphingomonas sp. TaxID=28214 RepID=UPI001B12CB5D|nr:8-amino-7-oxononanoate synthase [Sphingomonas sp.]MBO9711823.1 8-amino-7-oxononanoate synthase [Sphingomonas sp.]